ncbi:hypothetical protein RRF57_009977 [Xylaria bambusicola]|uniref:Uncharacterized protein n=1 Tax=Xylaria bambusicola TaxID=326684 RepID=A0AAN7V366_9PEZI
MVATDKDDTVRVSTLTLAWKDPESRAGCESDLAFKHMSNVNVSRLKYPRSTKSPRKTKRVSALVAAATSPEVGLEEFAVSVASSSSYSAVPEPSHVLSAPSGFLVCFIFFFSLGFVISGGSMSSEVITVVAVAGASVAGCPGIPPLTRNSSNRS